MSVNPNISFSLDGGISWSQCAVFDGEANIQDVFYHLEGDGFSMYFVDEHAPASPQLRMILLDFSTMSLTQLPNCQGEDQPCQSLANPCSSDYESFSPSAANSGCIDGQRLTITRRRTNVTCRTPPNFSPVPTTAMPCPCAREDYICELCYALTENSSCVFDGNQCGAQQSCQTGYRLEPGSRCDTSLPNSVLLAPSSSCPLNLPSGSASMSRQPSQSPSPSLGALRSLTPTSSHTFGASPSVSPRSLSNGKNGGGGLTAGDKAGIALGVIGGVCCILLLIMIAVVLYRKRGGIAAHVHSPNKEYDQQADEPSARKADSETF